MNASDLLEDLRRRDVALEAEGDRLHVDAPAGAITDDLRTALVEHKEHLLELLARERHKLEKAGRRGLAIRWSEYPVWIMLHDPLTGEWHEVKASECLPGVVETASRYRKKGG
jgi:tubulysin polyketide synthase-like protein